ncbi:MAG: DUF2326 domain-containing protein [Epsilonproteobacteria bacterium]|nr:DUF2326 domain-containing protein [Campylobacterota bacterium]
MILTKLYSNMDDKFEPIVFKKGLNIVLGEIRLPENMKKDTHNLGKSTLALLLDYCLLKGKSQNFFLFKHFDVFKEFVFFLELQYENGKYLTIKRGVENNSKISFIKHSEKDRNFVHLSDDEWNHSNLPLKKAKLELDSILNLEVVKPWDYRKPVSYALRSQDDYGDVFQLKKFGKHIDWKPYLSKLLGLDSSLVQSQYELKEELERAKIVKKRLEKELNGFTDSLDKLEGLILIKGEEIQKIKQQIDEFDFELEDSSVNKSLVEDIDTQLAQLNKDRYYISTAIEKLELSLNRDKIIFNPKEAKAIFEEAGVLFEGQIKKTYDELIQFNKDITKERQSYLKEELKELQNELKSIKEEISTLNKKRSKALYFLKDSGAIEKYKTLSNKLVELEAEFLTLKNQESRLLEYEDAKIKLEEIKREIDKNRLAIANSVKESKNRESIYSQIKLNFNAIIKSVLDKEALISISQNAEGNLDFKAEILDNNGNKTSQSDGKTYKKLLCMAFDLAVNKVYIDKPYTHFLYHDGFLEKLDNRKKENFIRLIREINPNSFQYIGTLIDSELPNRDISIFKEDEIILTLHDDGESGLLFKMPTW